MSGALSSIYGNINYALQLHSKSMFSLQEQAATGSRINRPSDDPSSAYRVLGLNSQKRYLTNFIKNIDNAISVQYQASSVVLKMSQDITEAMANMTQVISGTYGEGEGGQSAKNKMAMELNDLLESMVSSANIKHIDQFIFAGDNAASAPYIVERQNGEIVSITYNGTTDSRSIEVAPGVQADVVFAGDDIFRSNNRSEPVFYGNVEVAAGSGTSSVKGDFWLTVTNDGSNYKLSIDDGATLTTVPSNGDITNIAVTNGDGEVLYVDATNIAATGTVRVSVPGTYDIFNLLISTRDLLRNSQELSNETLVSLINKAAESLEQTRSSLVAKESSIGTKMNFLASLQDSLENIKTNSDDEATMLQQADIAQIAIDISRRQALYEMSLSVAGKLLSLSLLNFIK